MKHFIGLLILLGMIVAFIVVSECVAAPLDPPTKNAGGRAFLVRLLVIDSKDGNAVVQSRPYILVEENQVGLLSVGGTQVSIPGAATKESVNTGLNLSVKVSPLDGDRVRLDLSLAINDLKPTEKDKIRIVGHTLREIDVAKIGQQIHLSLDDDSRSVYLTVVSASTPR